MGENHNKSIDKPVQHVHVNGYISENRQLLSGDARGTMAEAAAACGERLGFAVSPHTMGQLMRSQGITTKRVSASRSKLAETESDRDRWKSRCLSHEKLIGKLVASESLSDELRAIVFDDLDGEVKRVIFGDK